MEGFGKGRSPWLRLEGWVGCGVVNKQFSTFLV